MIVYLYVYTYIYECSLVGAGVTKITFAVQSICDPVKQMS